MENTPKAHKQSSFKVHRSVKLLKWLAAYGNPDIVTCRLQTFWTVRLLKALCYICYWLLTPASCWCLSWRQQESARDWVAATHWGDLGWILSSRFQSSPVLATGSICLNEPVNGDSFLVSLPHCICLLNNLIEKLYKAKTCFEQSNLNISMRY